MHGELLLALVRHGMKDTNREGEARNGELPHYFE
jgi:hypothetical protein